MTPSTMRARGQVVLHVLERERLVPIVQVTFL
jgi:hypothetical protein